MRSPLPARSQLRPRPRSWGSALARWKLGVGPLCLLGSAALSGLTGSYFSAKVQGHSPFAFTCVSFALVALVFASVHRLAGGAPPRATGARAGRPLLGLNLATAAVFLSYFYALAWVEPAVVCAMEVGLSPAIALALTASHERRWPVAKDLAAAGLCGAGALGLAVLQLGGATGFSSTDPVRRWTGMLAALLSAAACAFAAHYSKQLSNAGWSSSRILAHRSYLVIPAAALLAGAPALRAVLEAWELTLLTAGLGVIAPLYLLQVGIQRCRTFLVMLSLSMVPLFAFLFQGFDQRIQWTWTTFLAIVLLIAASALGAIEFRHPPRALEGRKPPGSAELPSPSGGSS